MCDNFLGPVSVFKDANFTVVYSSGSTCLTCLLLQFLDLLVSTYSSLIFAMFCKASLITVTLALLVAANPIIKEEGIRIDLPKRSSLTKADGTFDHDKAILQTYKTIKCVTMASTQAIY